MTTKANRKKGINEMKIIKAEAPVILDLVESLETIRAGVNALYAVNNGDSIMTEDELNHANDYVFTHLFADIESAIAQTRQMMTEGKQNAI